MKGVVLRVRAKLGVDELSLEALLAMANANHIPIFEINTRKHIS